MASNRHKENMLTRLKEHGGIKDEKIEFIRWFSISAFYFRQPNHSGGVMAPGTKYYRRDGREYTFEDVPLKDVLKHVESTIETDVDASRRSEVWREVFRGIPGRKKTPEFEKPVDNPRAEPATPFSESRAAPGEAKSNADIIATLVSAADLNERQAKSVPGFITWWDSMDSKGHSGSITFGDFKVGSGRLGRPHTLEDVPNHYVRDRVLDYINDNVPEEKRDAVRKSVFPDLSEDELRQYSAAIAELSDYVMEHGKKKKDAKGKNDGKNKTPSAEASTPDQATSSSSGPTTTVAAPPAQAQSEDAQVYPFARVLGNRKLKARGEGANVAEQAAIMTATPVAGVDLERRPIMRRRKSWLEGIFHSVIQPGRKLPLPEEESIDVGNDIDMDCDQVRAMIKIFTLENDEAWTLDQFRLALGGISRPQMTEFLAGSGPEGGVNTQAFEMSWAFFKKRELLGLPLRKAADDEAPPDPRVLGEGDANAPPKGKKRASTGDGKKGTGKRAKATG
ncbi:hypothetical protein F4778DRAFT_473277 [Xylariomycetidae sp. FL2044]|nr:hypothetical protein F4778DRAFT_473277 [Xylariomycetidae sp. FL2044]